VIITADRGCFTVCLAALSNARDLFISPHAFFSGIFPTLAVTPDIPPSHFPRTNSHGTVRDISRETGIPKSSAVRFIKKHLQLKCKS